MAEIAANLHILGPSSRTNGFTWRRVFVAIDDARKQIDPWGFLLESGGTSEEGRGEADRRRLAAELGLSSPAEDGLVAAMMRQARDAIRARREALGDPVALWSRGRILRSGNGSPEARFVRWFAERVRYWIDQGVEESRAVSYVEWHSREILLGLERQLIPEARPQIALNAFLRSLDPHTRVVGQSSGREVQDALEATSERFGFVAIEGPDGFSVVHVAADSAAQNVGIRLGDSIRAIDGRPVGAQDLYVTIQQLSQANERRRVRLLLAGRDGATREAELESNAAPNRRDLESQAVRGADGRDYVVLKIPKLEAGTHARLRDELVRWTGSVAGVALDLRGNQGGSIRAAADVARLFLPPRQLISMAWSPQADVHNEEWSSRDGPLYSGPLVILVDETSAGSAEALAGSLQALARAAIVGRTTKGMGTLVEVHPFQAPNIESLQVTTRYFLLPDGRSPQRRGVGPDVLVASQGAGLTRNEEALAGRMAGFTMAAWEGLSLVRPFFSLEELQGRINALSASGHRFRRREEADLTASVGRVVLQELAAMAATQQGERPR